MSKLNPGADGESLPASVTVFRIGERLDANAEAIARQKALEMFFKPTSQDEKSPGKRLSVFAEELTVADEGWAILGSRPKKSVVACFEVEAILNVVPPPPFKPLEVHWEVALFDDGRVNDMPGAAGHAGIAGLCQGSEKGATDRDLRKALRSRLADRARFSPGPVPHDLPEEHLRTAAYYIHANGSDPGGTHQTHWVHAIRQLRRDRVASHQAAAEASPAAPATGGDEATPRLPAIDQACSSRE